MKGQLTIDHVLTVLVIITLISVTTSIVIANKESLSIRYETASIKAVVVDIARTITNIYVKGIESRHNPVENERVILARGVVILPERINQKHYDINITDNSVCASSAADICFNITGVPAGFNVTDGINGKKEFNISYWRERNNIVADYIIVG